MSKKNKSQKRAKKRRQAQERRRKQISRQTVAPPRSGPLAHEDGFVLMNFEVTNEPLGHSHSPQVDEWASAAFQALRRSEGETAAALLEKCLELEPDKPDLLNNLATAYECQGRHDEAEELARQIHERFPDYFFGRVRLAMSLIQEGDLDRANELLTPLLTREKFHVTEFTALCAAQVLLGIGRRYWNSARSWLDLWKRVLPDDPNLKRLESRVDIASRFGKLASLLGER